MYLMSPILAVTIVSCIQWTSLPIKPVKPALAWSILSKAICHSTILQSTTFAILFSVTRLEICRAEIVLFRPNYFTKKLKLIFLVGSNNKRFCSSKPEESSGYLWMSPPNKGPGTNMSIHAHHYHPREASFNTRMRQWLFWLPGSDISIQ